MTLSCPLCSEAVGPELLESHLRFELRLPLLACLLCPQSFCDEEEAEEHFHGPFAKHPATQPQLIRPPADPAKKAKLLELVRLARGGPEAVEQRLCVCGQCRLLCREDFRPAPATPVRPKDFRLKASPDSVDSVRPQRCQTESSPSQGIKFATERPQQYREEDSPDPEASFANEIGSFKPSEFIPPTGDNLWPATTESEANEHSNREEQEPYEQDNFHQSEVEAPIIGKTTTDRKPNIVGKKTAPKTKGVTDSRKELRCRPCDKLLRKKDVKEHTSRHHLRKTLFECKVCGYALATTNVGTLNTHIKKAHGQTPGPGTVDDSGLRQHGQLIEAMIRKLFGI